MAIFTATLITDGSSDRVLLPIVNFLLDEHSPVPHRVAFAEGLHSARLQERVRTAVELFPCDMLFVHRDAERASVADREREIMAATTALPVEKTPISVCIIPVRMTESWLLVDPVAIRRAAGNPAGDQSLALPAADRLESLPNPKDVLFRALTSATNLGPRRLRAFRPEAVRHRVTELMDDFTGLRALPSFRHFEDQVQRHFAAWEPASPGRFPTRL